MTQCAATTVHHHFIINSLLIFTFTLEGALVSNEIKEIFDLFDKNNRGTVATSELGTLVRALNLNPTETEI